MITDKHTFTILLIWVELPKDAFNIVNCAHNEQGRIVEQDSKQPVAESVSGHEVNVWQHLHDHEGFRIIRLNLIFQLLLGNREHFDRTETGTVD